MGLTPKIRKLAEEKYRYTNPAPLASIPREGERAPGLLQLALECRDHLCGVRDRARDLPASEPVFSCICGYDERESNSDCPVHFPQAMAAHRPAPAPTHCCFCGAYSADDPTGERACHACGRGGVGEADAPAPQQDVAVVEDWYAILDIARRGMVPLEAVRLAIIGHFQTGGESLIKLEAIADSIIARLTTPQERVTAGAAKVF